MKKKISIDEVQKYFNQLNLQDWEIKGNIGGGGQSHTVQVRNSKTDDWGVFRYLNGIEEIDKKRFYRELKVLIDPKYQHPNIVEILDYTKDQENYWYISRLGDTFESYWERVCVENEEDANKLLDKALQIVLSILEGLIPLHKEKVIHRDIKPKNIIVQKGTAQLIDFGLVFIDGEERLTPLHEAVGNARYSHDTQMSRLEEVPAWLDVFSISQLLIWMLQETPVKNWSRPLHWAYVIYPKSMSQENVLKLKAVTAKCSNPYTSPANAEELKVLILNLFMDKASATNKMDLTEIKEAIKKGKAVRILKGSDARAVFEAEYPLFLKICKDFEEKLAILLTELASELPIELTRNGNLDTWIEEILKSDFENAHYQLIPINFTCGEKPDAFFGNGVSYLFFTEKIKGRGNIESQFANKLLFQFTVLSSAKLTNAGKTKSFYCLISNEGKIQLIDGYNGKGPGSCSVDELIAKLKGWLTDREAWEITSLPE